MKKAAKRIPVLERLAKEMKVLGEAEQRRYIGGDYWSDHGVWSMDSNGNWTWTRTYSSSGGVSYGDPRGTESNPFTQDEYFYLYSHGQWRGGYVQGYSSYIQEGPNYNNPGPDGGYPSSSGSYGSSGGYDPYGSSGSSGSGSYDPYGGSGSSGSGGSYDPCGNSGSSGSSGDPDENQYRDPIPSIENQQKWENIKFNMFYQANSRYNIDLSSLNIKGVGNDSWSNAWIGPNKEVCLEWRFFNLPDTQKLRVLFEEYYHVKEDKPFDTFAKKIQITLPEPSEGAKKHLMTINNFLPGEEAEFQKWYDKEGRYDVIVNDPNYNWNEVNANTKTKEKIYNQLSEKGRNEIDYKIWFYNLALDATKNN